MGFFRRMLALSLKGVAILIGVFGVLYTIAISFSVVYDAVGLIGTVFAMFLAPIVFVLVPWYFVFSQGIWFPLIITYGTIPLAGGLFYLAESIKAPR
jgi:hypothetical protein